MPVSASSLPKTTLALNDRGNAVHAVEQALARLGFLRRDGYSRDEYFGTLTRDALKKFQRAHKLTVTGRYDLKTRAALAKALSNDANRPSRVLKLNATGKRVRALESRLARLGLLKGDKYARDGYFGTLTRDALLELQKKHNLARTGTNTAGTRATVRRLLEIRRAQPKTNGASEPAHNYSRVNFRGATVNARTRAMVLRAEQYLRKMGIKWTFAITQGSYTHAVSASGGTHDRGGALDISVRGPSGAYVPYARAAKAVKALRMAGFAAWSRGYSDGTTFTKHIHAIAIGDRELSSAARSQVGSYFAGRSGLVGNGLDRDRGVGRQYPDWAKKYR